MTNPNAPFDPQSLLDQLDRLEEMILDGSRVPFTGSRLVNEQEAVEALDALRDALSEQISRAEEWVARARRRD